MSRITRSSNIAAGGPVATLTNLTSDQITTLTDTYGIKTTNDLLLLEKGDINDILGNDSSTF